MLSQGIECIKEMIYADENHFNPNSRIPSRAKCQQFEMYTDALKRIAIPSELFEHIYSTSNLNYGYFVSLMF